MGVCLIQPGGGFKEKGQEGGRREDRAGENHGCT